jgi:hypothetical protein
MLTNEGLPWVQVSDERYFRIALKCRRRSQGKIHIQGLVYSIGTMFRLYLAMAEQQLEVLARAISIV